MIFDIHIFVCCNDRVGNEKQSCGNSHGLELITEFKKQINDLKLDIKIRTNKSGCLGICNFGPTVAIYPEGMFYVGLTKADVTEIVQSHILNKIPVERLLLKQNH